MCDVHARIEDRDLGVESRVSHAVDLVPGDLRQSPLIRIVRVRWRALPLPGAIRLDALDLRVVFHPFHDRVGGLSRHLDDMHIQLANRRL